MAKVNAKFMQAHFDAEDRNPDYAKSVLQRHVDALEMPESAKQHMIQNGQAEVLNHLHANSSERMTISAMKTAHEQIPALNAMHARIQGGGSGARTDNDDVDDYISKRPQTSSNRNLAQKYAPRKRGR